MKQISPEHTPGPQFNRAVYGFSFYLIFNSLFLIYVVWAFVPDEILADYFYLTYLPDKYFALYIPILILVAMTLFAFLVYPAINMALTPDLDSLKTVSDSFSIRRCAIEKCWNPVPKPSRMDQIEQYCEFHKEGQHEGLILDDDKRISDFCDCKDNNCLLRSRPRYLQSLRTKRRMPSVGDIDIIQVSNILYGN